MSIEILCFKPFDLLKLFKIVEVINLIGFDELLELKLLLNMYVPL